VDTGANELVPGSDEDEWSRLLPADRWTLTFRDVQQIAHFRDKVYLGSGRNVDLRLIIVLSFEMKWRVCGS
jgi:hypothetical protein